MSFHLHEISFFRIWLRDAITLDRNNRAFLDGVSISQYHCDQMPDSATKDARHYVNVCFAVMFTAAQRRRAPLNWRLPTSRGSGLPVVRFSPHSIVSNTTNTKTSKR